MPQKTKKGPSLDLDKVAAGWSITSDKSLSRPTADEQDADNESYQVESKEPRAKPEKSSTVKLKEVAKLVGVSAVATLVFVAAVKHGGNKQDLHHSQNTTAATRPNH